VLTNRRAVIHTVRHDQDTRRVLVTPHARHAPAIRRGVVRRNERRAIVIIAKTTTPPLNPFNLNAVITHLASMARGRKAARGETVLPNHSRPIPAPPDRKEPN